MENAEPIPPSFAELEQWAGAGRVIRASAADLEGWQVQVLKRQVAITQILGTVRLLARAIEQIEQVVAGIRTTNLVTLQRTGELRVYADALDVRIGEVDTRLTELTQSLMAHRERTTVVVSETRDEYRRTLGVAVEAIRADLAARLANVKEALAGELAARVDEVEAKQHDLAENFANLVVTRLHHRQVPGPRR